MLPFLAESWSRFIQQCAEKNDAPKNPRLNFKPGSIKKSPISIHDIWKIWIEKNRKFKLKKLCEVVDGSTKKILNNE